MNASNNETQKATKKDINELNVGDRIWNATHQAWDWVLEISEPIELQTIGRFSITMKTGISGVSFNTIGRSPFIVKCA